MPPAGSADLRSARTPTLRLVPDHSMSFPAALRSVISQAPRFRGRASRSEFWWYFLAYAIVGALAAVFDRLAHSSAPAIVVGLALLLPTASVAVRRLHDTGRYGTWALLVLLPFVGWISLLIMCAGPSTRGENQFGPSAADEAF